ncbi:MAG: hypothetical protein P9L94_03935 [Candidatus Hinthialibacter antarcticus]|nr:hypothetical protein [Candidatus Hinthialibacter antarcticus]
MRRLSILFALFVFVSQSGMAQEVDLVEYFRFNDPPVASGYVGQTTDGAYVTRFEYTPDFSFNGFTTLKQERLSGPIVAENSVNTNYFLVSDTSWDTVGVAFTAEIGSASFPMELKFDPPISTARFVAIGDTITQTGTSLVFLAAIPVNINFNVTMNVLGFESLETPLGQFDNTLKMERLVSFSIPGLEERIETTEWYHPSVGLVRSDAIGGGDSLSIQQIEPPLDTGIRNWKSALD